MNKKVVLAALLVGGLVAGCASSAKNIQASYVSPVKYQNYSCGQLAEEARRVASKAREVAGVQDQQASNDAVATGVALVLFWPAAFLVSGGDGQTAQELAKLKGQKEAIELAGKKKGCRFSFESKKAKKKTS